MRPASPTHEQGLQEEQKSDRQDEISIEQSLADDQDTNLSTGPMPHLISLPQKNLIPTQIGVRRPEQTLRKRTSYATSSLAEIGA
eukprot:g75105.t1